MRAQRKLLVLAAVLLGTVAPIEADATTSSGGGLDRTRLVTGLAGGSGSTVGPDGALYVTEPAAGRISRIDPRSGRVTTFADGLPVKVVGNGGAMDVAFIGRTAYAIVSLVGADVGGTSVVGLYRVDGRHRSTVVADIGTFNALNPPDTDFFVPSGLQYAMEPYRGGFLITDGHLNRILWVSRRRRDLHRQVVRQHRADRARTVGADGLHGRGRPGAPRARRRQGGRAAAAIGPGDGGRLGRSAARRRRARPRARSLCACAGPLRRWGARCAGAAEHRQPRQGEPARLVRPSRRRPRPADSFELIGRSAYVVTLGGEVWRLGH